MKTKNLIPAILIMAALLSPAIAQEQPNNAPPHGRGAWHGMTPQERLDHLSQRLNLSDDQKTKVQAAFKELHQKMQAARTSLDTELQGVLTSDQYQQLKSMRHHHMHHMAKPEKGAGG